jgi:hypothetical protein
VLVNPEAKEKIVQLNGLTVGVLDQYTTDAANNLKRTQSTAGEIRVPAKSVVTLTGKYQ